MEALFEDPDYLVVNKPRGVHSDEVLTQGSNWELVHRLDFETSGCLLFCRPERLPAMRELFKAHHPDLQKIYVAGASHALPPFPGALHCEGFIGGRYRSSKKVRFVEEKSELRGYHGIQPVSHVVQALPESERPSGWTGHLYRVTLESGARHQIRAWFAAQDAPLVGDPVYGKAEHPTGQGARLELHAQRLKWRDPVSRKAYEVSASL